MRNLWLLGGDAQVQQKLEEALGVHASHVHWKVHVAKALSDIPQADLLCNGNVIICDAFHPTLSAFEGLKAVRAAGFSGAVFLAGEPSPELSISAFTQNGLTGYFPSFDRSDFHMVAGLIENQLFFEGQLSLQAFLAPAGRASVETIGSFDDFNQFGAKLATFVGKFGIETPVIKKLLMGLGLPHIKGQADGPSVEQPFQIHFGMDPLKLLVAVSSFSRGANKEGLLGEFTQMLGSLKDQKAMSGTMFPEIFHVGQCTQNLMLLSGNSKKETSNPEPLFLITALPFPKIGEKPQGAINLFSFLFATPTAEAVAPELPAEVSEAAPIESPASDETSEKAPAAEAMPATNEVPANEAAATTAENQAPAGVIPEQDIQSILTDPEVLGDPPSGSVKSTEATPGADQPAMEASGAPPGSQPAAVSPGTVPAAAGAQTSTQSDGGVVSTSAQISDSELTMLRQICVAMGNDIRRLMRERRIPSTDRELRDAVTQMEEKVKAIQQDRAKFQKSYDDKTAEIEALKEQIENMRKKAA